MLFLAYLLSFVIGGAIAQLGLLPLRAGYIGVLGAGDAFGVLGRNRKMLAIILVFVAVIMLSAVVNSSSIVQTIIFLRIPIIPVAMFALIASRLNPKQEVRLRRFSLSLALVQLPIVVIQQALYDSLIKYSVIRIRRPDYDFGTFFAGSDPSLAFFLQAVIIGVLFGWGEQYSARRRYLICGYLSFTVLFVNSNISYVSLAFIWIVYWLRNSGKKAVGFVVAALVLVISFLVANPPEIDWNGKFGYMLGEATFNSELGEESFLSGGTARAAAIVYYIGKPLKILGDGPSRYYNPLTQIFEVGNAGHLLTLYAEVGFAGLILSYALFWSMITRDRNYPRRLQPYVLLGVLIVASVAHPIASDATISLAFALFLRFYRSELPDDASASQNKLSHPS